MSQSATDHQLGQRFAQLLKTRRPVELQTALNLLQDLMGADVSLLPSIRLLASQPTFLQFINAKPANVLLPQRDALLVNAKEILAPAQITRIANFLDGYLGASNPASQSSTKRMSDKKASKENSNELSPDELKAVAGGTGGAGMPPPAGGSGKPASEPQMPFKGASIPEPSFPAVLSKSSEELPSTVVDQFAKPSSSPAAKHSSSNQSGSDRIVVGLFIVLVVLTGLSSAYALFTVPALCEPLGLCSAEEEKTEEQKEREKEDSEKPDEAAETPSTPKEKAPVEPQAEQRDRNVESTGPVAPVTQNAPQRNEPLW